MHYSPLQGLLNPLLQGRYVSPLEAVFNQRPPGTLLNFGVTPSALLGVLRKQDQQRYAMIGAALERYSSLGLTSLSTEEILAALGTESKDEQYKDGQSGDEETSRDETVLENDLALNPIDLTACREAVKAELADLEKQRKALLGQQKTLSTRFSEIAGKFQLLKLMENEAQSAESIPVEVAVKNYQIRK